MIRLEYTQQVNESETAVVLGKFDGIHKGHQVLLSYLKKEQDNGKKTIVYTFDRPPESIFSKTPVYTIDTNIERSILLNEYSVDYLIEVPFTKEYAAMEAVDFIEKVLHDQLHARTIIVGEDFHFGSNNKGDVKLLQDLSEKYEYQVIAPSKLELGGAVVSSTRIRNEIRNGNMPLVTELLGRPYFVHGTVKRGNQIGRTMKFPTLNISLPKEKLLPPFGVYAAKLFWNKKIYQGMVNIGVHPSVKMTETAGLEMNVFDFEEEIYDQEVDIYLFQFIRPEMKFSSLDALMSQIAKDKVNVQHYF